MKKIKKVYESVKYQYDVNEVSELEVNEFIKEMANKKYDLQDSYWTTEDYSQKELLFTKYLGGK
ncbi:hypothetical protein D3C81_384670 [compost metagenome]